MAQLKQVCKAPNEIFPFTHPVIEYPQLVSTKFDGFRMLSLCGERQVSPKLKNLPNQNLASFFSQIFAYAKGWRYVLDGELWSPDLTFSQLSSVIRSHHAELPASLSYYIFDMMTEYQWDNGTESLYIKRNIEYTQLLTGISRVVPVNQTRVMNAEEAQAQFDWHIEHGHEGIIMRSPYAKYKHGRFTDKQDGMWKFKEFVTHDAVIIGVEEQMKLKEGVDRTRNELGNLERRYEQDLYEPAGMVGAFVVRWQGQEFKVKPGRGFDNNAKTNMWSENRIMNNYTGRHIEFKYMPHGTKDKPRIGSLVRFRPDLD